MAKWKNIEQLVEASQELILTENERELIAKEEQQAYESNISIIKGVLDVVEQKLVKMGFWMDNNVSEKVLRFRFSLHGYYGPGGFISQYHVSGPLVLGVIHPAGDEYAGFFPNDIDKCFLIGLDFNKEKFEQFVLEQIEKYLQPENLITSKEQYERFRDLLRN